MERLVEEQKLKRRFSNRDLMRRISGNLQLIEEEKADDILNESFPEHFHYMKVEDSINEMRPMRNLN